ncbi:MAG: YraN family protein [Halanaerobium sp.]
MALHNRIGRLGEQMAAEYLRTKDYYIIEQNYYNRFGEIDIVAEKNTYLVFTEVKTRSSEDFFGLEYCFNNKQMQHLKNTAKYYIFENNFISKDIRFDLILIKINFAKRSIEKIEHYKNVIEE